MTPPHRAGDRRLSTADRVCYALIAAVLLVWLFLDGGLR